MPHVDTPTLRKIAAEKESNPAAALAEALEALFEYYDHDLSESGFDGPGGSPMKGAREIFGRWRSRPDPLGEALNSGDGTYRP